MTDNFLRVLQQTVDQRQKYNLKKKYFKLFLYCNAMFFKDYCAYIIFRMILFKGGDDFF